MKSSPSNLANRRSATPRSPAPGAAARRRRRRRRRRRARRRGACSASPRPRLRPPLPKPRRLRRTGLSTDRPRASLLRDDAHLRRRRNHHAVDAQELSLRASPVGVAAATSALVASLARGVRRAVPTMDRRAFLRRSGLGVGVGLATAQLTLVKKAEAADPPPRPSKSLVVRRTVCIALLGRLRGRRGGRERRLGPPGAGVRFAAQPRRALRQGRCAARARPRRLSAEDADEAGRQQVREDLVGPGAERDQRQDARARRSRAAPTRSSSSARRSTTTSRPTCCASG